MCVFTDNVLFQSGMEITTNETDWQFWLLKLWQMYTLRSQLKAVWMYNWSTIL